MQMAKTVRAEFDFDYWASLWKDNPEAFEIERLRAIEAVIASAPEEKQPRLRSFQWRIEVERQRSKTPLAAYYRISKMMWDSLLGEHGLLKMLTVLTTLSHNEVLARQAADVLPFRRPKKDD
jgi:hypothetical protein